MRSHCRISGSAFLEALHAAQHEHPLREVWAPRLQVPTKLIEYVSAVTADFVPQVRQEAILLLKRYVWRMGGLETAAARRPHLQVVALTCAHLAIKHWQSRGIPEQKLHWLSRNAYTRQDFMDAEVDVLRTLDHCVHWEGVLLAEWQAALLFLVEPLFAEASDALTISGVAAHVTDVLAFQDELMAEHLPSELAAATLHAAVTLCTKQLQRYTITLRIGHLCRVPEEQVAQISERILGFALGGRYTELLLEGSGVTAEDSDLDHDDALESENSQLDRR